MIQVEQSQGRNPEKGSIALAGDKLKVPMLVFYHVSVSVDIPF